MNTGMSQKSAYYVQPQGVIIPGLKVAYGIETDRTQPQPQKDAKSWLGRLKNTVVNLVTEEAEADRPIGIAQLSKRTFLAHPGSSEKTMVRHSNPLQDYRFRFISEPRQR